MSPETTIQKARKALAATLVHHFFRDSSRTLTQHRGTRTRTRSDLDQRLATSQLQQPSSTSTVSLSTSTSTTKSDAMHEPQNNSPATTNESLIPAGWISPAYPGACVWGGSVRSLGPPRLLSGHVFLPEPKKSCHGTLGRLD